MGGMSTSSTRDDDDFSESRADDYADGQIQHVAAHYEGFEFFEHERLLEYTDLGYAVALKTMTAGGTGPQVAHYIQAAASANSEFEQSTSPLRW